MHSSTIFLDSAFLAGSRRVFQCFKNYAHVLLAYVSSWNLLCCVTGCCTAVLCHGFQKGFLIVFMFIRASKMICICYSLLCYMLYYPNGVAVTRYMRSFWLFFPFIEDCKMHTFVLNGNCYCYKFYVMVIFHKDHDFFWGFLCVMMCTKVLYVLFQMLKLFMAIHDVCEMCSSYWYVMYFKERFMNFISRSFSFFLLMYVWFLERLSTPVIFSKSFSGISYSVLQNLSFKT